VNKNLSAQFFDFADRTIAITGGAGILGGSVACGLVELGANVAIIDRDPSLADRLLDRMEKGSGRGKVFYGDVLDQTSLEAAIAAIHAEFGPTDTLINAAGGNYPGATTGIDQSFFDLPADALGKVFDLNLIGTILPSQVFGKSMADQGQGNILNFSSMSAIRPLTRIPAYSAAKSGVSNFTQWLAVHMAQEYSPKIRVNALAPGFFLTQQNQFLLTDESTGELTERGQQIIDHTPLGRFGQPEDLLGTVAWLLSDSACFVTGIVVPVDGGFSAYGGV
jgi:NAD(P)-dependent dehydrogenase (short-subunit alcohol dehydrogenase family)